MYSWKGKGKRKILGGDSIVQSKNLSKMNQQKNLLCCSTEVQAIGATMMFLEKVNN